jgi:3-dehydroquinate synthase
LKTLNKRELRSGLAEVVKYGAICSPDLFEFIEDNIDKIFALDKRTIERIVMDGYTIKADIVHKDEFDNKDLRIILNFGHTIGHAVEFASNFAYRHGEAISIGMVCANDIAVRLGLLDKSLAARIENLLLKIGLPVRIKNHNMPAIMNSFRRDKKFINGKNRFVLITKLGRTMIKESISETIIKDVIKKRFA